MSHKRRPAISHWKHTPPMGGWGIEYVINGHKFSFEGQPGDIVQKLFDICKKNRKMSNIDEAWEHCNEVWCSRDPKRCSRRGIQAPEAPRADPAKRTRREAEEVARVSPTGYGSKIWEWLNTFGMKGGFVKSEWEMTINRVSRFLDPAQNPATGCQICHDEWQRLIREHSPGKVGDNVEAARWVFWAHNKVNRKLSKPQPQWDEMIAKNHWYIPNE